ncbi:ABC transporter ATP-binding protein [Leptotrichia sp. OH3620_COT-345]|uniref:ABC transporter ATP-binding protein n=1 Tax=Leptotrichia sp. OH3620_COT-345 TaxID=2491048 RepID=UPI000F652815|nr:ABC transporter ATP-binding protein [Leptotrichia sp. OH3620_COT-345]RRD41058.1 ABC transporter ATP-binding protein [Leptotrichia sp. OH3620_COT-345]
MIIISKIIEFKNVYYFNKDKTILDNVSFFIEKNKYNVITGKNGAGKTTLVKLITGLEKPQKGEIFINGALLKYTASFLYEMRKKMGVVFQYTDEQLIGETVIDSLIFGMENNCIPYEKMKILIKKYTELFKMENLLSRRISQLSGGEKQKVALVSALVTEPEIIILDEALEMFDNEKRKEADNIIRKLMKDGKTVISVSHDTEEIEKSDNIIILNRKNVTNGKFNYTLSEYEKINNIFSENNERKVYNLRKEEKNRKIKIKLKNVSYTHEKNSEKLFDNLSFSIPEREITVITGKSGTGKTTLFELMYGFIPREELFQGEIFIDFSEQNDKSDEIIRESKKRNIIVTGNTEEKEFREIRKYTGYVFQNPENQFFQKAVKDEIEYNITKKCKIEKKNKGKIDEKVKKALITVGLSENYEKRSPFTLSSGEKRLLGIATAICTEPTILFLDEPTVSLDYEFGKRIMELLKKLKENGMTIVMTTHNKGIINEYADNYIEL